MNKERNRATWVALLAVVLWSGIPGSASAQPAGDKVAKAKAAYENRLASTKSLAEVLKPEIARPGVREALAKADASIRDAAEMAAVGEYDLARSMLDDGDKALKASLNRLMSGSEVTASKTFATPAEEYRYEQARNADYAQLIAGIVERSGRADWREAQAASRSLREQADRLAGAGDWVGALKLINEATERLKTILRRAGFPIV